jgi:hypothetical protein
VWDSHHPKQHPTLATTNWPNKLWHGPPSQPCQQHMPGSNSSINTIKHPRQGLLLQTGQQQPTTHRASCAPPMHLRPKIPPLPARTHHRTHTTWRTRCATVCAAVTPTKISRLEILLPQCQQPQALSTDHTTFLAQPCTTRTACDEDTHVHARLNLDRPEARTTALLPTYTPIILAQKTAQLLDRPWRCPKE